VTGKALVLCALGEQPLRYADLRRGIEGISQKMLAQTLRRLQRDGLEERRSVRANSSSMQYRLTPLGSRKNFSVRLASGRKPILTNWKQPGSVPATILLFAHKPDWRRDDQSRTGSA
jgi:DNA-binding PadR family transcriptional regulator